MAAAAPIPPALAGAAVPATSWAPTAKVSAGVLAASAGTLLFPLVKKWIPELGPEAAAAITTIITFIVQYLVPERT